MHNDQSFECIAVADASQSTLSGYFGKPKVPVKDTAGESKTKEQDQNNSEQCHSLIQKLLEEDQVKDEQAQKESGAEKKSFKNHKKKSRPRTNISMKKVTKKSRSLLH
eukprot:Seg3263.1 transcript_id=Seg3263.1/GoldUCD/mRNA.D3Y31 product="hypothetical protein" protein_id=Seg3263.1/GoldUCD/D3Y31